jgi:hypothetical protein
LKKPLTTKESHRKFIQSLPCAKCNGGDSCAVYFGDYPIPVCGACHVDGGISPAEAGKLARKLWLLSGDVYSAIMTMIHSGSLYAKSDKN